MIKQLLINHLVSSLLVIVPLGLFSPLHQLTGAILGAALMGINLLTIVWVWQRIFQKKSIALAASVIVIKYAILGAIIYFVLKDGKIDPIRFIVGLSSILPTMIFFGLSYKNPETTK